jgi:hypothetical protein
MSYDSQTSSFQTPEVLLAVTWMWVETFFFAFEVAARILVD